MASVFRIGTYLCPSELGVRIDWSGGLGVVDWSRGGRKDHRPQSPSSQHLCGFCGACKEAKRELHFVLSFEFLFSATGSR